MLPEAQDPRAREQQQLNSHTSVLQQVNRGASSYGADSGPEDIKLSGAGPGRCWWVNSSPYLPPCGKAGFAWGLHPELWDHLHLGDGKNQEWASHISPWFTLAGNGVSDALTASRQGGVERRDRGEGTRKGSKRRVVCDTSLEAQGWKGFVNYLISSCQSLPQHSHPLSSFSAFAAKLGGHLFDYLPPRFLWAMLQA